MNEAQTHGIRIGAEWREADGHTQSVLGPASPHLLPDSDYITGRTVNVDGGNFMS